MQFHRFLCLDVPGFIYSGKSLVTKMPSYWSIILMSWILCPHCVLTCRFSFWKEIPNPFQVYWAGGVNHMPHLPRPSGMWGLGWPNRSFQQLMWLLGETGFHSSLWLSLIINNVSLDLPLAIFAQVERACLPEMAVTERMADPTMEWTVHAACLKPWG